MAFDWLGFLDGYGVPYITRGANVARNHVSVHCPFCGAEDESQHMSINLQDKGWRCYRADTHQGKNPARLVAGLLGISRAEADRLVGNNVYIPEDFLGHVSGLMKPKTSEAGTRFLKI